MPQRSRKSGRRRRPTSSQSRSSANRDRKRRDRAQNSPATSNLPLTRYRRLSPLLWLATAGLLIAGAYLINDHGSDGRGGGGTNANATADGLLNEMQAAYRNLNAYSDVMRIEFRGQMGDRWVAESAIINTHYQRPNRLRFAAERPGTGVVTEVISDGKQLQARVRDPASNDFDQQVVQRAAPSTVDVSTLFSATQYADVSRPGELNTLLVQQPMPLQISQLSLLMDAQPLAGLLDSATKIERIDDSPLDETTCYRVAASVPNGRYIFWIDSATKLMRRLEFPQPGEDSRATGEPARLVCDFTAISTEPLPATTFQWQASDKARLVRNFVLPPSEVAPDGLNEPAGNFSFTDLTGQPVPSSQFEGKITVLCWFDARPANRYALDKLQIVRDKINDATEMQIAPGAEFAFVAVCNEPATKFSHADVESLKKEWNLSMPVVRDLAATGRDQFSIQGLPSVLVIDAKGVVQLNEPGIDPQFENDFPQALKMIAEGKSIAADYLAFLFERRSKYDKQLTAASVNAPTVPINDLPADIPQATTPKRLQLTKLWGQNALKDPGNIYVQPATTDSSNPQPLTYFALDGWRDVVELDSEGKIRQRHTIAKSESTAVRRLKMATNKASKTFRVGWSTLSKQVVVLDNEWQTVMTYPQETVQPSGVLSAEIADLDGDGQLELYVAFAKSGIHCVELNGQVRWQNNEVAPARSMTRSVDTSGAGYLLTTSNTGQIVPIDPAGQAQQAISVGVRAIHTLHTNDADADDSVFCGFTFLPTGELLAVGLKGNLNEEWTLGLPPGGFRNQIDFATAADWFHEEAAAAEPNGPNNAPPKISPTSPYWILAGPSGSVSVVSHLEEFNDHFQSGQELTGIAAAQVNETNVLLLSGKSGIAAYAVEKLEEDPESNE